MKRAETGLSGLSPGDAEVRLSLAKQSLAILTLAIGLDYVTSWTMMSLLGPSAEGSAVTREFFVMRTTTNFLALLGSQWAWAVLLGLAAFAYFVYRYHPALVDESSRTLSVFLFAVVLLAWLMATYRLALGAAYNMSALVISTSGPEVGYTVYLVLSGVIVLLVALDFAWVVALKSALGSSRA